MADPYLGQITIFAGSFVPVGYAACDGSLLNVSQNSALFALIGTTYGGDGQNTFGLPDLRGRLPVGRGQGAGLQSYAIGQTGGTESVSLNSTQIPVHPHSVAASTDAATSQTPGTGVLYGKVTPNVNTAYLYTPVPLPSDAHLFTMNNSAVASAGAGQAHENRMPMLAVQFIIATEGIYPPRS